MGGRPAPSADHLYAVDVVRLITVGEVIGVHATSLTVGATTFAGGLVLVALHVSRSVFVFLSAFVLAHRYRQGGPERWSFWRRRYPLVLIPYAVWTLIYGLADGHFGTPLSLLWRFAVDLADDGARYHLYFLLVTVQLYAVFPWVLRRVRRWNPWRAIGISVAIELVFTAGSHYWSSAPGVLGAVLDHPGSWLWTYQLFVVAGIVAAGSLGSAAAWVRAHSGRITMAGVGVLALGLAWFSFNVEVLGETTTWASGVFQPAVVVEAMAAIAVQFALGLRVERTGGVRLRRALAAGTDASFGVYLAHPLLLQGGLAAAGALGVAAAVGQLPVIVQLVLVLLGLTPALFLTTGLLVGLARRSPLSLPLTGRPRRRARTGSSPPALPPPAAAADTRAADTTGPDTTGPDTTGPDTTGPATTARHATVTDTTGPDTLAGLGPGSDDRRHRLRAPDARAGVSPGTDR